MQPFIFCWAACWFESAWCDGTILWICIREEILKPIRNFPWGLVCLILNHSFRFWCFSLNQGCFALAFLCYLEIISDLCLEIWRTNKTSFLLISMDFVNFVRDYPRRWCRNLELVTLQLISASSGFQRANFDWTISLIWIGEEIGPSCCKATKFFRTESHNQGHHFLILRII